MELTIRLTDTPKAKPTGALGFGRHFTDHMFVMQYDEGQGWHDARIEPYASLSCDPAIMVFHYGQAIFEGMKAYKNKNGEIRLFRPRCNFERMNDSAGRMCMPAVDVDFMLDALKTLVEIEKDWIPSEPGTSLYIRPFMIATDVGLGVHASKSYLCYIICCPVGAYYAHGFQPVSLKVEDVYVRAAKGGTGHHKFAGNYAASILAAELAGKEGYDQVMWLDAAERRYVEEVGSMNIFFVMGGKVVTPMLAGSILPGVTRRSCIEFLRARGYEVEERLVSIDEVLAGVRDGSLTEIFGSGTAAVISPVGKLGYKGEAWMIGEGKTGPVAQMLYDEITGIQTGVRPDTLGWVERVR